MNNSSIKFITSATKYNSFQNKIKNEYAFIGRSNVGKSSLINSITGLKKIAKISSTPGKTRTINFFDFHNEFILVDLPGYGYAKLSRNILREINFLIKNYIFKRKTLKHIFLIIDIRHNPIYNDLEFIKLLYINDINYSIIFNKSDKIKNLYIIKEKINIYLNKLKTMSINKNPDILICSCKNKNGINDIISYIKNINNKKP